MKTRCIGRLRQSVCMFVGTLAGVVFLMTSALVAQADVITTVPGTDFGPVDVAVGPDDELYLLNTCFLLVIDRAEPLRIVPPTGERQFIQPLGIAIDQTGNIYVGEAAEDQISKPVVLPPFVQPDPPFVHCNRPVGEIRKLIWKITPEGEMAPIVGMVGEEGNSLSVVAVDMQGQVYFYDHVSSGRLWKRDLEGNLLWLGGTGERINRVDISGGGGSRFRIEDPLFLDVDGKAATEVKLNSSSSGGGCVDEEGNIYLAQFLYVRKIEAQTGIITTIAGNGTEEYSGDGGPALEAGLVNAVDVVRDRAGNLYVSDQGSRRVRRIDPQGIITTIAGTGEDDNTGDGGDPLEAALVPWWLALDSQGDLYVMSQPSLRQGRVRKISFTGDSTLVDQEDMDTSQPQRPAALLLGNAPNPGRWGTVIAYSLPTRTWLELEVFNLAGQKVRTLIQGQVEAGNFQELWDGRDAQGTEVSNGIYIVRLRTNQDVVTRKVVIAK